MSRSIRRFTSLTLYFMCAGVLMIVLDTTVVTVALPSIIRDLGVSGASSTWLLNAYMLTYGGFLLLSGRLGDLYGRRRVFLAGVGLFTLASLACGLSHAPISLLVARAIQGLGGAVVAAVSLSLITSLFPGRVERAKALGVYGFVCAAGGGVGELMGGLVTQALNWHWIFLVNVPIGLTVYGCCRVLLPRDVRTSGPRPARLDVFGALSITSALTLLEYVLVTGSETGWSSTRMKGLAAIVVALLMLFVGIESRAREPLLPLRLLRLRNFTAANLLSAGWAAATFGWSVMAALYLQRVLGYAPFEVGLAFVPAEIIVAVFSAGPSAPMVARFGMRQPLWIGLLLAAAGLGLFARAPSGGAFIVDVLPGMVLLGLGTGVVSSPLLLAAMNDVDDKDSGVASGLVNTSFMMGGSLGLAVLASLADLRARELQQSGSTPLEALNGGYHFAFLAAAVFTAAAAILSAIALRPGRPAHPAQSMAPAATHALE